MLLEGMLGFCAKAGFFIRVGLDGLGDDGVAYEEVCRPLSSAIGSSGTPAIS